MEIVTLLVLPLLLYDYSHIMLFIWSTISASTDCWANEVSPLLISSAFSCVYHIFTFLKNIANIFMIFFHFSCRNQWTKPVLRKCFEKPSGQYESCQIATENHVSILKLQSLLMPFNRIDLFLIFGIFVTHFSTCHMHLDFLDNNFQ